jgi:fructokinase
MEMGWVDNLEHNVDITCLGELLIDMFPAETGRPIAEVSAFRPVPGGAPANAAVAAARLGAKSAFIGKVGDEAFGHHLSDVLAAEGVDVRGIRFDSAARTTLAFIAKPDPDHAEFVFYRNPGADTRLTASELDGELLGATKVFHFGLLSLSEEPIRSATWEAVRIAREGGALVSFDVNFRPTLWRDPSEAYDQALSMLPQADLVKLNETELEIISDHGLRVADLRLGTEQFESQVQDAESALARSVRGVLERGPKLCVVTFGPNGSYAQTAEWAGYVPAFRVKAVDALGCGDAFMAGLLWQLVSTGEWRKQLTPERLRAVLRYANAVGAITAQTMGVIPALPSGAQVERFLNEVS